MKYCQVDNHKIRQRERYHMEMGKPMREIAESDEMACEPPEYDMPIPPKKLTESISVRYCIVVISKFL